jgi:hypothetical protein
MTGKSNLFTDKEYEDMEWLSKAIEPYVFYVNELLAKLPDQYDLTIDDLLNQSGDYYNSVSKIATIETILKDLGINKNTLDSSNRDGLLSCFTLEVDPDTTINLIEKTINGTVRLVKTKVAIDDEEIRDIFSHKFQSILWDNTRNETIGRLNELMDLLGVHSARKSRSTNKKLTAICEFMGQILKDDVWKIRNEQLVINLAKWMADFLSTGNLASLANITRLKCMTYNQHPLYSMQETV